MAKIRNIALLLSAIIIGPLLGTLFGGGVLSLALLNQTYLRIYPAVLLFAYPIALFIGIFAAILISKYSKNPAILLSIFGAVLGLIIGCVSDEKRWINGINLKALGLVDGFFCIFFTSYIYLKFRNDEGSFMTFLKKQGVSMPQAAAVEKYWNQRRNKSTAKNFIGYITLIIAGSVFLMFVIA